MTGPSGLILSVAMLGAGALILGGVGLIRRGGDGKTKGILMLICAVVLAGNVLIWTL